MNLVTDPIKMIRDIRALENGIGNWGAALNMPQIIGGLIFVWTLEGAVVLATVILTFLIAGQMHRAEKFSRLISICHLPWLIMVPWLIARMLTQDQPVVLSLWLAYVIATILISLVLDTREIWLFLKGDRVFVWAKSNSAEET